MKNRIPLKELNLTSRFLFDEVMKDRQTHQDVLSIIFGEDIPLLTQHETEKEFHVLPELHSIRMDVFSMDEEGVVYNTEMQEQRKNDLAKRSRFYQALLDSNLLEPGVPNYNLLNKTYIIMIMSFDLFGYQRYQYTFRPVCDEEPDCILRDGATRIFLNTKGKNEHEVSSELVEFLHYVEKTTDEAADKSGSDRIKRIHNRVRDIKISEEVGIKYMQAWEERYYDRLEAREEGMAEGLAEGRAKGLAEGLAEGRAEGRAEGELYSIIRLTLKKLAKDMEPHIIAEQLEEGVDVVIAIRDAAEECEFDVEKIYNRLYR